jgi:hypothetical protein
MMTARSLVPALATLVACGCSSGSTVKLPAAKAPVELIRPDASNRAFLSSERVTADFSVSGIDAGILDIRIEPTCNAGHEVLDFTTAMRTTGVVRFFARRDGEATTRLNRTSGEPEKTSIWVDDGSERRRYEIRYRPGRFGYSYARPGRPMKRGNARVPGGVSAHDMQSAMLLLRSWRPEEDTRGFFFVVLGYRLWRADVVYRGIEVIEVGGVKRRSVRVEGVAHKLKKKAEDKPRSFALWFDEASRVPLKVVGEARFGTVEFELTAHEVSDGSTAPACPPA